MAKKKKQVCPECGKVKNNLNEHIRICHPDYKPEDNQAHAEIPAIPPTELPAEPVAPPVVEVVPDNPPPQDTPKETAPIEIEREKNSRNYVKIILAVPLFLGGAFVLLKYSDNPITILFGAAVMAGAFFLARSGWVQGSVRIVTGAADKQGKSGPPPNSLVLHCKDATHATNWLAYEYVERPLGQRKKRRNDGKWFYVMREVSAMDRTLIEHTLPDNAESEVYCDPAVMANALSLQATKRMFDFSPDNIKAISLMVMMGIVIAEIIGLIAMVGDKNQAAAIINFVLNGGINA